MPTSLLVKSRNRLHAPNAEAVAEKMTEFIENPELIKTLGAASAEYAREKFSVDKVNDDTCCHLNIERTNKYAVSSCQRTVFQL